MAVDSSGLFGSGTAEVVVADGGPHRRRSARTSQRRRQTPELRAIHSRKTVNPAGLRRSAADAGRNPLLRFALKTSLNHEARFVWADGVDKRPGIRTNTSHRVPPSSSWRWTQTQASRRGVVDGSVETSRTVTRPNG
jgi:hypothetical protein